MASAESNQRRRAEEAPGAGLYDLMSLPSEIIDNILAQLPFDKLVRTLRRRWESVADLDIWFDPGSAAAPDARVLWRCAAPIHGFTTRVRMRHFHRAARWLLALARKRVQKLVLRFDNPSVVHSPPVVGPALFSCRALTHLELYGDCYLPRAPRGFQGFPDLVTLVLHNVLLPFPGAAAQLQRLISSAPGLMELSLYDVNTYRFEICAIRAPSLRIAHLLYKL